MVDPRGLRIFHQDIGNHHPLPLLAVMASSQVDRQTDETFPLVGMDRLATKAGGTVEAAAMNVDPELARVFVVLLFAIASDGHFSRPLAEREVFALMFVEAMDEPGPGIKRSDAFRRLRKTFAGAKFGRIGIAIERDEILAHIEENGVVVNPAIVDA
jgi:hypothetical protein